jgi:CBS domain-containing protein
MSDGELQGERLRIFMRQLLDDLRALERILADGLLEEGVRRIGAEQELFLVDGNGRPAPVATRILEAIGDPHFTTELGLFNFEINLDPLILGGDCLSRMERQLAGLLAKLRAAAADLDAGILLAGILPTLRKSDLGMDNMTPNPRYHALNHAMTRMRGGAYEFHIQGLDELIVKHDSLMLEACNASFQVHFQVGAGEFANLYNIAQVVAGPVLASACNSPLLFGRRLWKETRIALFEQSIDTRARDHELRDRRPRVTFGRDWVRRSVLELFQEDVARFRAIIGTDVGEDVFGKLEEGITPDLRALRVHNSTVYRWNRACYGMIDGKPHIRIENRVLPSGPSVLDEIANTALWFGAISCLARDYEDITQVIGFEDVKLGFYAAARQGMSAQLPWLEGETMPAPELIRHHLAPMARRGLEISGIDHDDIERYISVIEKRVEAKRSGARWQLQSLTGMRGGRTMEERVNALTAAIVTRQADGSPVGEWEPARLTESGDWKHSYALIEQFMTTDLFTVHEDESLDLAASLMEWERIRHVPVEDHENRLVGLVSYRSLLRLISRGGPLKASERVPVSEIMERNPITVTPDTSTLEAIALMRRHRIGCLPVVNQGRLVGLVTEHDFMNVAGDLLEQKLRE